MAVNHDWRRQAVICAMGHYARDVVDGTPEGNAYIGQVLFPLGGNPVDPEYKNGAVAWCGRFVEAVFRPLGFRFSLDSVGRVLSYAHYNRGRYAMKGAPDHIMMGNQSAALESFHRHSDDSRTIFPAWSPEYTPRPGDIALHQREPGSWHGHVMKVLNVHNSGDIRVIEGNNSQTFGPTGDKRDGIGTRVIEHGDPYLNWIVVPSDLDFDPDLRIGTKEALAG
jgi:hypothetical protein